MTKDITDFFKVIETEFAFGTDLVTIVVEYRDQTRQTHNVIPQLLKCYREDAKTIVTFHELQNEYQYMRAQTQDGFVIALQGTPSLVCKYLR